MSWVASAALFMPRLICVAFEHIAEYRARRFQGLYGPLLRLLSWRVDEVWADCAETLEETRRYFRPRRRARHVIPLFVAEGQGPFKTDYALGSRLRLAAAGRLVARKNLPVMVEAVGALSGEDVDATLDVYGDGPEKQALETLIVQPAFKSASRCTATAGTGSRRPSRRTSFSTFRTWRAFASSWPKRCSGACR